MLKKLADRRILIVTIVVLLVLIGVIVILSKIFNMPLLGMAAWAVYFSMYGTRHLYNYIFTRDKVEIFQSIVGILFGSACFLGMTVLLIK